MAFVAVHQARRLPASSSRPDTNRDACRDLLDRGGELAPGPCPSCRTRSCVGTGLKSRTVSGVLDVAAVKDELDVLLPGGA